MYGYFDSPPVRIGMRSMLPQSVNSYPADFEGLGVFNPLRSQRRGPVPPFIKKLRTLPKSRVKKLHFRLWKLRRVGVRVAGKKVASGRRRANALRNRIARLEKRFIRVATTKFRRGVLPRPNVYRNLLAVAKLSKSPKRAGMAHELLKKMSGRT